MRHYSSTNVWLLQTLLTTIVLILCGAIGMVNAGNGCVTVASGNWDDPASWTLWYEPVICPFLFHVSYERLIDSLALSSSSAVSVMVTILNPTTVHAFYRHTPLHWRVAEHLSSPLSLLARSVVVISPHSMSEAV